MTEISSSSILRITDEKTMQLIDLYQKEECLWNTSIKDYRNKAKRSESVHRIARTLGIPNFTARHVLMKFKNLRNSYSQELKKIANSKASVTGEAVYKPSVFWFQKMNSFIRPHLQKARGTLPSNLVYLVDGNEEWVQLTGSEEAMMTAEMVEPSGSENESCESMKKLKHFNKKRSRMDSESDEQIVKMKKDSEEPQTSDQKTIARSLKDLSANVHVLMSRNEDYFDSFGKYIAGLLRSLPHRKALEVQPQIISVITAAGLLECQSDGNQDSSVIIKLEK